MKTIFFLCIIGIYIPQLNVVGVYSFNSGKFHEEIELLPDNKFVYHQKREFLDIKVVGNYKVINDGIILDSYPQRDKIIVKESSKTKHGKTEIRVKDKFGSSFYYSVDLFFIDGTVISLQNQYEITYTDKTLLGFTITDSKGLSSPKYIIKGGNSKCFDVQFESNRVFENEFWQIKNKEIIPIGFDGLPQKYRLVKTR
ncbi:hypothetical protein GFJ99_05425 [Flavobacterium sp. LMO6]|nr:hypothetical protein [Flavobacterium sp. LMO6]